MAGKSRPAYSNEFREDAVRQYRSSGKSILTASEVTGFVGHIGRQLGEPIVANLR